MTALAAEPGTETPGTLEVAAIDALGRAAVRWATMRDDPLAHRSGDIDLLVAPGDVDRLDGPLAAAGFARLRTWRHGSHRFFFAYDQPARAWVKLDVVSRLEYQSGARLPETVVDDVLSRTIRVGGLARLAPDDEFWALLLHCLLDRGSVAPRHLARLRDLATDGPAGPIREALAAPRTAERAVERAAAGDEAGLRQLIRELDAALDRPSATDRARDHAGALLSPILKAVQRPGLTIAVLGPDGAGKSTLVRALAADFVLPARTMYLGLYGGRRARTNRSIPGVTLARQLGMTIGASIAAAYHRRRGRLVILDRSGYDVLVPPPSGQRGRKRRIRELLIGRLSARPDLVVILDAPADVLARRKAEHSRDALERWRSGYRSLPDRLPAEIGVEILDASQSPKVVQAAATAAIWRRFAARSAGRREVGRGGR
jgi:thymidylate kinase